jgi:hypothetical protein
MVEFDEPTASAGSGKMWGWVESVGYAMIDRITFSVGSHDVEILTGENLNIINELMRDDTHRYGYKHVGKTGRPFAVHTHTSPALTTVVKSEAEGSQNRVISVGSDKYTPKKLIVPLGLFFMKHPSAYFPLAAIAGCNDVRIQIKFKPLTELLIGSTAYVTDANGKIDEDQGTAPVNAFATPPAFSNGAFKSCQLRCHYVHVTGPEATALMNREHVRLMKLWHGNQVTKQFTKQDATTDGKAFSWDIDLSFLHPVQEIVITIRKVNEISGSLTTANKAENVDRGARGRNYFAYQGGGYDPNIDGHKKSTLLDGANMVDNKDKTATVLVDKFKLTLNGQSRHLDGQGLDREYLMERLMPMMHSNTSTHFSDLSSTSEQRGEAMHDFNTLAEKFDRKEIYVYPFALNPEGQNPSGSVNFSKVSHARLTITGEITAESLDSSEDYQVDVYGVYYNWLAIKDGRALTSFA